MYLSRRYVVALVVALIALAAYVVIPKLTTAIHNHDAHEALVAADAAFKHLRVPADFKSVPQADKILGQNLGCQWYPCYRVPRSTKSVRPQLPEILRSTGAQADETLGASCTVPTTRLFPQMCAYGGISHGYEVLIFLDPIPTNQNENCRKRAKGCFSSKGSLVEINQPYIPPGINGDGTWPVKP